MTCPKTCDGEATHFIVHVYYNRSLKDVQLARTVVWVGCTVILARFEIFTVTLPDCYALLADSYISEDCGAFTYSSKGFTASCMCMLMLWFCYELVLIGYFFWKGAMYCLTVKLNSFELTTIELLSLVRFPMVSLEFFIDIILLIAQWPWGQLNL